MVYLKEVEELCDLMKPSQKIARLTDIMNKTIYISSYHFAVNVYTIDRRHQLDILFGGDYQQLAGRIRRSLKVLKKYNITPVFYQEQFSSEKSVEEDSERRTATYERGQEFIPKSANTSDNERKFNWHSNVSWLSFCMYQIFKEENIRLLDHETMENIHKRAANDNDAVIIVNNIVGL